MIPYGRHLIDDEDVKAVVDVLRSDWLTQGPKVEEFEKALCEYCAVKYGVVFSSGTAALHAAYFAAGFASGDEFVVTPMTFVATVNAALWFGAKPIFADIDARGNIDPNKVKDKITSRVKAIVAVDFAGHPAGYDALKEIAGTNGILLIEDACHSLGASYGDKKVGSLSDMTVFSFHPVKSITTGEGGAVVTDSKIFYERLKQFRSHGIVKEKEKFTRKDEGEWYYEMQELGLNYRLTDIQAALGLSQLKKLDRFIERRKIIAKKYQGAFFDLGQVELPSEAAGVSSSWHLYPIRIKHEWVKKKTEIFARLREAGIGVQTHYIPVYLHPYYQKRGFVSGLCPMAEEFYQAEISLPIYPGMTEEQQDVTIKTVTRIIREVCTQ